MRTLSLSVLLAAACAAPIQSISYSPQPLRSEDPRGELKRLILANTVQGCVTEPEFTGQMFVVKAVCTRGVGNQVLRFDRVKSVVLEQSDEWFRCRVSHTSGEDFWWSSKSLEDMQQMADAVSALTSAPAAKPAPASTM